ncbi:MAG: Maf family protein [Deferrisomatales bacterium]
MSRLVLASASPRRRELLSALQVAFDVVPSGADEALPPGLAADPALEAVARRKALEVLRRVGAHRWVLAADTGVVLGREVFGKPAGRAEAEAMLRALSGRTHRVVTAVALAGPGPERVLSVSTDVTFRALSEPELAWYAGLAEPYDKAGAYAIQGQGAFLVAAICGSYTNVVGLPMAETADLLAGLGLAPWSDPEPRRAAGG